MKKIFLTKSSLFKIIACASMLGMVASCTDYLGKYQDEVEEHIVAENAYGDISSNNESDVFSSATVESNGSIAVSSNSKGADGSNSSSGPNNSNLISSSGSSSSVATSSSSEDAANSSEAYTFIDNEEKVLSDTSSYPLNQNKTYSAYYDITNWDGLIIDYESDIGFHVGFGRASDINGIPYTSKVWYSVNAATKRTKATLLWSQDINKIDGRRQALLSASNFITIEPNKGQTNIKIYSISSISKNKPSIQTESFKIKQENRTLEWKVDAEKNNTKNKSISNLFSIDSAQAQCNGDWKLPSKGDYDALDTALKNKDFIYSILVKDSTINQKTYYENGERKEKKYAFWISDSTLIKFDKVGANTYTITNKEPSSFSETYAFVHCIKKDN